MRWRGGEAEASTSQGSSARSTGNLPTAYPLENASLSGSGGRGKTGGGRGSGSGNATGRGKGGKGATRVDYNWLCGFCHKPQGNAFHNSKYCAKPFVLPPLSELSRSACVFCNHDHLFVRCPILSENGVFIVPSAYIRMARELQYPVKEVHGRIELNLAAILPRLEEAVGAGAVIGGSRSSSQTSASSEGGSVSGDFLLSGSEDRTSLQVQVQQVLNQMGEKLMTEMGRQLTERFGTITAGMTELSRSQGTLQERVLQQAHMTTNMIEKMQQQLMECRTETKEAQEKSETQLQEAMARMAALEAMVTKGAGRGGKGKGAGGAGAKDLASTQSMDQ